MRNWLDRYRARFPSPENIWLLGLSLMLSVIGSAFAVATIIYMIRGDAYETQRGTLLMLIVIAMQHALSWLDRTLR